jgi:hypothetical protein
MGYIMAAWPSGHWADLVGHHLGTYSRDEVTYTDDYRR